MKAPQNTQVSFINLEIAKMRSKHTFCFSWENISGKYEYMQLEAD